MVTTPIHIFEVLEAALARASTLYKMPRAELDAAIAARDITIEYELNPVPRDPTAVWIGPEDVTVTLYRAGRPIPVPEVALTLCGDCLCYYPAHEQHLCPYPTSI